MIEDEQFQRILNTREYFSPYSITLPLHTDDITREQIINWLICNVGYMGMNWKMRKQVNGFKYYFLEEEHKTLFALTWL